MRTLYSSILLRCSQALDQALTLLRQSVLDSVLYELYRSAWVKEFDSFHTRILACYEVVRLGAAVAATV